MAARPGEFDDDFDFAELAALLGPGENARTDGANFEDTALDGICYDEDMDDPDATGNPSPFGAVNMSGIDGAPEDFVVNRFLIESYIRERNRLRREVVTKANGGACDDDDDENEGEDVDAVDEAGFYDRRVYECSRASRNDDCLFSTDLQEYREQMREYFEHGVTKSSVKSFFHSDRFNQVQNFVFSFETPTISVREFDQYCTRMVKIMSPFPILAEFCRRFFGDVRNLCIDAPENTMCVEGIYKRIQNKMYWMIRDPSEIVGDIVEHCFKPSTFDVVVRFLNDQPDALLLNLAAVCACLDSLEEGTASNPNRQVARRINKMLMDGALLGGTVYIDDVVPYTAIEENVLGFDVGDPPNMVFAAGPCGSEKTTGFCSMVTAYFRDYIIKCDGVVLDWPFVLTMGPVLMLLDKLRHEMTIAMDKGIRQGLAEVATRTSVMRAAPVTIAASHTSIKKLVHMANSEARETDTDAHVSARADARTQLELMFSGKRPFVISTTLHSAFAIGKLVARGAHPMLCLADESRVLWSSPFGDASMHAMYANSVERFISLFSTSVDMHQFDTQEARRAYHDANVSVWKSRAATHGDETDDTVKVVRTMGLVLPAFVMACAQHGPNHMCALALQMYKLVQAQHNRQHVPLLCLGAYSARPSTGDVPYPPCTIFRSSSDFVFVEFVVKLFMTFATNETARATTVIFSTSVLIQRISACIHLLCEKLGVEVVTRKDDIVMFVVLRATPEATTNGNSGMTSLNCIQTELNTTALAKNWKAIATDPAKPKRFILATTKSALGMSFHIADKEDIQLTVVKFSVAINPFVLGQQLCRLRTAKNTIVFLPSAPLPAAAESASAKIINRNTFVGEDMDAQRTENPILIVPNDNNNDAGVNMHQITRETVGRLGTLFENAQQFRMVNPVTPTIAEFIEMCTLVNFSKTTHTPGHFVKEIVDLTNCIIAVEKLSEIDAHMADILGLPLDAITAVGRDLVKPHLEEIFTSLRDSELRCSVPFPAIPAEYVGPESMNHHALQASARLAANLSFAIHRISKGVTTLTTDDLVANFMIPYMTDEQRAAAIEIPASVLGAVCVHKERVDIRPDASLMVALKFDIDAGDADRKQFLMAMKMFVMQTTMNATARHMSETLTDYAIVCRSVASLAVGLWGASFLSLTALDAPLPFGDPFTTAHTALFSPEKVPMCMRSDFGVNVVHGANATFHNQGLLNVVVAHIRSFMPDMYSLKDLKRTWNHLARILISVLGPFTTEIINKKWYIRLRRGRLPNASYAECINILSSGKSQKKKASATASAVRGGDRDNDDDPDEQDEVERPVSRRVGTRDFMHASLVADTATPAMKTLATKLMPQLPAAVYEQDMFSGSTSGVTEDTSSPDALLRIDENFMQMKRVYVDTMSKRCIEYKSEAIEYRVRQQREDAETAGNINTMPETSDNSIVTITLGSANIFQRAIGRYMNTPHPMTPHETQMGEDLADIHRRRCAELQKAFNLTDVSHATAAAADDVAMPTVVAADTDTTRTRRLELDEQFKRVQMEAGENPAKRRRARTKWINENLFG